MSSRHEYNAFFVRSILNSKRDSYVVIEIAHALVSSRTSVHGQGHRDNKRVMMNDVLPSKKWARAHRAARAHVGSLYEALTRFNGLKNYYATGKPIVTMKCICVSILHDLLGMLNVKHHLPFGVSIKIKRIVSGEQLLFESHLKIQAAIMRDEVSRKSSSLYETYTTNGLLSTTRVSFVQ